MNSNHMNSNQPIQYQKGYVEFYKLKFKVTKAVLIPRPETELLVDEVLSFCNLSPVTCSLILDLGTGSGNIAISIAKNLPNVQVTASEISKNAINLAKQNAKFHQVNIEFLLSNLLENIVKSYDVIVTNLPYIPTERIPYLESSVKDWEPYIALNGGEDGFELYRKLFEQIKKKNIKFNLLIGEIDYTHGELAVNEALKYFPNAKVEVKTDLTHKQRILKITG